MSATGSLLVLLGCLAAGPPSVDDLTPLDRQTADFYGAISTAATGVRVTWKLDKTTVPSDGELVLTLTVDNVANPSEITRPDLSKLAPLIESFQVFDLDLPPTTPEVKFAYRLRPRGIGVLPIPSLKFVYYRPSLPEGKRFRTTYADPIAVSVTSAVATPEGVGLPIEAPEHFFALPDTTIKPRPFPRFGWLVPLLLLPVVVVGYMTLWRLAFPNAVRRAKLRRNRAARQALDRLEQATQVVEIALAIRQYLEARFELPPSAATPTEVNAALTARGHVRLAEVAERFLTACDAARFAPPNDTGMSLAREAQELIAAWEGCPT